MEFYVLKVITTNGDFGLASKSGNNWTYGHKGFDTLPSPERRLSLKDAKLGKKAISKWTDSEGLKFEIVRYKIEIIQEVIL